MLIDNLGAPGTDTSQPNPFDQFDKNLEAIEKEEGDKLKVPVIAKAPAASEEKKTEGQDNTETAKENVETPEGATEEWKDAPKEYQEKFEKQRSSYQKSIQQYSDKVFTTEKEYCEKFPERLVILANSGDSKDRSMAKRIAREVWDKSLTEAVKEVKEANPDKYETDEEKEKRIERDVEYRSSIKALKNSFISSNKVLDKNSTEYNKEAAEEFDDIVKRLSAGEDQPEPEEMQRIYDKAYYLATKDIQAELAKKTKDADLRKIAAAGGGTGGKMPVNKDVEGGISQEEADALFEGMKKSL